MIYFSTDKLRKKCVGFFTNKKFLFFNWSNWEKFMDKIGETNWWNSDEFVKGYFKLEMETGSRCAISSVMDCRSIVLQFCSFCQRNLGFSHSGSNSNSPAGLFYIWRQYLGSKLHQKHSRRTRYLFSKLLFRNF